MGSIFSIFSKKRKEKQEEMKALLREKYFLFQELLNTNNEVLTLMAELSEKLSGEYLFDIQFIKSNVEKTSEGVLKIIKLLNSLADNKYHGLYEIYEKIKEKIENTISHKIEIPVTDFTLPLESLSKDMVTVAGGKMANLAEIKKSLNIPTPEGFVITSYAYLKFLEFNDLKNKINDLIEKININKFDELESTCQKIKELIINSPLPEEIELSIKSSYEKLCNKINKKCNVSVRSSAIHEDSYFSFAGQYSSFLNVPENEIIQKYKEVIASLFNPRAVFYYKTKGFSEKEMVMAVGVLPMIDAYAGGVMYTKDPNNPESGNLLINSVKGLGKLVVDGEVTPDNFSINRDKLYISEKFLGKQNKILICKTNGDIDVIPLSEEISEFSLSDEQVIELAKMGMTIENYYENPQDIEWAIDKNGKIFILQTRLLRVLETSLEYKAPLPTRLSGYTVILDNGSIACRGVGYGKAFLLKDEEDIANFPEGYILVAKHTDPSYVLIMNKASAIIIDSGCQTEHVSSIAREYRVPMIINTENATKIIKPEQEITVDAYNCVVYEGKVKELLEISKKSKKDIEETQIYRILQNVSKLIISLNLVDPTSENFKIENCQTFHDITRYCHEMVMYEMFTLWDKYDSEIHAVPLIAGIPIGVLVLDICDGLKENIKKATLDDIFSIPFKAILKGMTSMKWPDPPPIDTKGFLGMIANTATIPEEQLRETGKKSFCIVTKNYMNFSIRLGYHFSLIEAYAGDKINDNYIKFFFKGGGAAIDRRLRRVKLITEILKKLGFKVVVKEDVIDAIITKYPSLKIEKNLEVLGKLTAYTKQLDMVLFNDSVAEMFTEDFIRQHIPKE